MLWSQMTDLITYWINQRCGRGRSTGTCEIHYLLQIIVTLITACVYNYNICLRFAHTSSINTVSLIPPPFLQNWSNLFSKLVYQYKLRRLTVSLISIAAFCCWWCYSLADCNIDIRMYLKVLNLLLVDALQLCILYCMIVLTAFEQIIINVSSLNSINKAMC